MGRDTTADSTPILKQAEQNLGNSTILVPENPDCTATGIPITVIPNTNPARLLNVTGGSAVAQTISIVMTASRIVGADNPNPGYAGPVTGIVEFGNGGRFTRVEFDVPVGAYAGFFTHAANAIDPQAGGAIVTVPTSVVRAYARYDNLLLAPLLNTNPPISLAQLTARPTWGPGGPRATVAPPYTPPTVPAPILAEPLLVQAMAAYFTRPRSSAYKTLYLYASDPFVASASPVTGPNTPYAYFCLPAFTKKVKILREPITTNLDVVIRDGAQVIDQYVVAAGSSAPEIKIQGQATIIGIESHDLLADQVEFLALSCEVGV
jgi:hypothetical protein